MKIIGKITINPVMFYSGKICGYILWLLLVLHLFNISFIDGLQYQAMKIFSYVMLCIGLLIIVLSLINLGKSTSLGLPSEEATFITNGIYRFSRIPMYFGFNLITLASIAYSINVITMIMGLYNIVIYHFIILGEEIFLENRFGTNYIEYKGKVRRYI